MKTMRWLDINCYKNNPEFMTFLQTPVGKLAMLVLFGVILAAMDVPWWPMKIPLAYPWWPLVMLALAITTCSPAYRNQCLSAFSVVGLFWLPWFSWPTLHAPIWQLQVIVIVAVLVFCLVYIFLAQKMKSHWLMRHPIVNLIVLMFIMIWLASYWFVGNDKVYCWMFVAVLGAYFWYLSYTLLSVKQLGRLQSMSQVVCYLPFWGGTATPFPKGRVYLNKIESKNPLSLAECQLSAFHLLVLAILWHIALDVLLLMQQAWQIPAINIVLPHLSAFSHESAGFYWRVLLLHFVHQTLFYGMNGHIIIAIVRMAGFNAARNMDNPFFATSVADFWNRYYFYFKELLVEVFFYPTYFFCFKKHPKIRLVFATFMAAGVGNVIYHIFSAMNVLQVYGLWRSLWMMQAYFFYAVVLSIAISVSQLRSHKVQAVMPWWRRYVTIPVGVVGFYCVLSVFNEPYQSTHLVTNFQFLAKLVGV